jgi:hypothetical protein
MGDAAFAASRAAPWLGQAWRIGVGADAYLFSFAFLSGVSPAPGGPGSSQSQTLAVTIAPELRNSRHIL